MYSFNQQTGNLKGIMGKTQSEVREDRDSKRRKKCEGVTTPPSGW